MLISRYLLCVVFFWGASAYADRAAHQPLSDIVVYPERSAPATVRSLDDSVISSQLNAVVKKVNARVSQFVERDDVLVELDCLDFTLAQQMAGARVESAQAAKALAKGELARAKDLLQKKLASQQQYDIREAEFLSAEAQLKQQRVALKQAQVNVDRCQVRAPFSGVVTERMVSVGQLASMGLPLVALVGLESLELSAQIPVADYAYLDQVADFVFDYGERVPVKLHNNGGVINSQTRNVENRFVFAQQKPLAGTAGRLHWRDPRAFIPAKFIVKRNGRLGAFLVKDGANDVTFFPLEKAVTGRPAPVDLPLSTRIVTQKLSALNHGDTLN